MDFIKKKVINFINGLIIGQSLNLVWQLKKDGRQIQHMDKNRSFENTETSLQRQITAFVDYCEKDKLPDSNMAHTKRVTYIVECMEKSLKSGEVVCPSKEY